MDHHRLKHLRTALKRTASRCHLCLKRVCLKNYGVVGARGAWELDHVRPRAVGGTDHGNNLLAACITCNRSKQARSTRLTRAANGVAKRPMSEGGRARARERNAWAGAAAGALTGLALSNPITAVCLALAGAALGHNADPE